MSGFAMFEAFEHAPPIGGIVEVRRFGGADDQRPTLVLANRSDFDLARQVTAPGATWLDHRLVEREPMPLSMGGFGGEVRDAMTARAEHLADEGFARRQGQRIILQRDLLATLRRRELDAVGAKLSAETGLPHLQAAAGETCRRHLPSDADAHLRQVRHDRQRPGLPARPMVAIVGEAAWPACLRRGERRRRHRVGVWPQAGPWIVTSHQRRRSFEARRLRT